MMIKEGEKINKDRAGEEEPSRRRPSLTRARSRLRIGSESDRNADEILGRIGDENQGKDLESPYARAKVSGGKGGKCAKILVYNYTRILVEASTLNFSIHSAISRDILNRHDRFFSYAFNGSSGQFRSGGKNRWVREEGIDAR